MKERFDLFMLVSPIVELGVISLNVSCLNNENKRRVVESF